MPCVLLIMEPFSFECDKNHQYNLKEQLLLLAVCKAYFFSCNFAKIFILGFDPKRGEERFLSPRVLKFDTNKVCKLGFLKSGSSLCRRCILLLALLKFLESARLFFSIPDLSPGFWFSFFSLSFLVFCTLGFHG